MSILKLFSWCFFDRVEIGAEWRDVLHEHGFEKAGDFIDYGDGTVVSREVKQPVRRIELSYEGKDYCFFLKQQRVRTFKHWFKLVRHPKRELVVSTREYRILEMCRRQGLAVMDTVAWGERRLFFWPVAGFILADGVTGEEFIPKYLAATAKIQRKMMRAYGRLVGIMHSKQINSKVKPRDIICVSGKYQHPLDCYVLIDRERGKPWPVKMDEKISLKQIVEVWQMNAGYLDFPGVDRILAFWLGYSDERKSFRNLNAEFVKVLDGLISNIPEKIDHERFVSRYSKLIKAQ